jgi:YidC/Oxa1 family membrane protein insertase
MDRKGLLIVIVTIGIAFGWHYFYVKPRQEEAYKKWKVEKERYDAEQAKIKEATPQQPTATTPGAAPTVSAAPAPAAEPPKPVTPEERKTVSSEVGTVDYVFTSHGGGISRVVLKEHFDDKAKGTPVVLNEFGNFPIGALAEKAGDPAFANLPWTMSVDATGRTVTFERTDDLRKIKVTKSFTVPAKPDESDRRREKLRSEYIVDMQVKYTNVGTTAMMVPKLFLHLGGAAPINEGEVKLYQGFDYWRDGSNHFHDVSWFDGGGFLFWKRAATDVFQVEADMIRWAAVTNQYFTTMATAIGEPGKSDEEERSILGTTAWAKRRAITPDEWRRPTDWRPTGHVLSGNTPLHHVDGALGLTEIALAPQQEAVRKYQIYAGPREYRRLRLLDNHEQDVLDYGTFLGIPTSWFSKGLLNAMNGIYFYITKNYALAIVLLTILVKSILWPLQSKANKSMKKMAELQPQMKILQDKYKQDPVKFQQEMGKMWKKAGVNPLSGCWPIMIQIPIFIGFYNMLGKAVELRHHGFLWVNDLAAPDTVAHILGIPINPLPLLMAGTMFLQMKMAPQGAL